MVNEPGRSLVKPFVISESFMCPPARKGRYVFAEWSVDAFRFLKGATRKILNAASPKRHGYGTFKGELLRPAKSSFFRSLICGDFGTLARDS
jgi:hypothetical protein